MWTPSFKTKHVQKILKGDTDKSHNRTYAACPKAAMTFSSSKTCANHLAPFSFISSLKYNVTQNAGKRRYKDELNTSDLNKKQKGAGQSHKYTYLLTASQRNAPTAAFRSSELQRSLQSGDTNNSELDKTPNRNAKLNL